MNVCTSSMLDFTYAYFLQHLAQSILVLQSVLKVDGH